MSPTTETRARGARRAGSRGAASASAPTVTAPTLTTAAARGAIQRALLAWFRRERRDLPWRRTRDPYAIWISESMLQQTRVETVRDYWPRFLERFPDVASLARASEDAVLAAWSGLGYYRRARALRSAARAIVERHGGEFPREAEAALELDGVGRYTAGAVLSIAFDARLPVVDGNVERVFARLFLLDAPHGSPELGRRLWELAEELLPARSSPGEWNQALMELGALVCTPRAPRCDACPLAARCAARAADRVDQLPRREARRAPVDVRLELLLVRRGGAVLVERRDERASRMAGLEQLPTRETDGASGLFPAAWSPPGLFEVGAELARLRHAITHHRIQAVVRAARVAPGRALPPRFAWRDPGGGAALTGMAKKALARCAAK